MNLTISSPSGNVLEIGEVQPDVPELFITISETGHRHNADMTKYIDKGEAIQIINHLQEQFKI